MAYRDLREHLIARHDYTSRKGDSVGQRHYWTEARLLEEWKAKGKYVRCGYCKSHVRIKRIAKHIRKVHQGKPLF